MGIMGLMGIMGIIGSMGIIDEPVYVPSSLLCLLPILRPYFSILLV